MTNSIFDRFSSTDTASVQRKQRKQKQGRILRIEELENRELLSATPWNMAALMPSSSWDDSIDASTQVVVSSASASANVTGPRNITLQIVIDNSAGLSWVASMPGASYYEVRYCISGSEDWKYETTDRTSLTLTGLSSNTNYWTQVRACIVTADTVSVSEWSSRTTVITQFPTVTSQPALLPWNGTIDLRNSVLEIRGTNSDDWIKIQETNTQVIVRAFGIAEEGANNAIFVDRSWSLPANSESARLPLYYSEWIAEVGQWSFDKNGISQITFWGFGGNDTFIGAYEGVSTTIAMRLDGVGGDNWLVGGAGNDWIYSGLTGNSHLDPGAAGDSMVIGGRGANVFYNGEEYSNCFIWMGEPHYPTNSTAGRYSRWADGSSDMRSTYKTVNDGFLRIIDNGQMYSMRQGMMLRGRVWTEAEVMHIADLALQMYQFLGSHAFLQKAYITGHPGDTGLGVILGDRPEPGHNILAVADSSAVGFVGVPTLGVFVHEIAHVWSFRTPPAFQKVGFSYNALVRSSSSAADYTTAYGRTHAEEDWATTVEWVVAGRNGNWAHTGSSAIWHQKVALVHQFFAHINPNYVPKSPSTSVTTPTTPSPGTPTNPTTPQNPTAPPAVKPKVRLDKKATTTTSLTINLLAPNSRTSLEANAYYLVVWRSVGRHTGQFSGRLEGVTEPQITLTGLNPGTRYAITIIAHNENGWSGDSKGKSASTGLHATTQRYDTLRVQKLRSDNSLRTADSLTFTWQQSRAKHVADAVVHYRIEVLDRTTGQTIMQTTTTDLRFTLTELDANTRYTIRVQEVATIDGRDILSRIAQLTARTLRLV